MCFWTQSKKQHQQNKKSNIKTVAGAGNLTRDLLHPKRMRYHFTTESTDLSTASPPVLVFMIYASLA